MKKEPWKKLSPTLKNKLPMPKLILLLWCLFSLQQVNAQKSNQTKPKGNTAFYVNVNIDIAFKDKGGVDLLDSTQASHLSAKDILLYNIVKGEKIKVDKPHMDHPNNHFLYRDENTQTNYVRVYLECEKVLLQLSPTSTDTITCKIKKTKGNTHIEKVWYNKQLVWELGKSNSQQITIIK